MATELEFGWQPFWLGPADGQSRDAPSTATKKLQYLVVKIRNEKPARASEHSHPWWDDGMGLTPPLRTCLAINNAINKNRTKQKNTTAAYSRCGRRNLMPPSSQGHHRHHLSGTKSQTTGNKKAKNKDKNKKQKTKTKRMYQKQITLVPNAIIFSNNMGGGRSTRPTHERMADGGRTQSTPVGALSRVNIRHSDMKIRGDFSTYLVTS